MIPTIPQRASSPMPESHHDKTHLRQRRIIKARYNTKLQGNRLGLGPRVNIGDNRVLPRGIKIRGFPHIPIQIRHVISRFHREHLRHLPSRFIKTAQIRRRQFQHDLPVRISQHAAGCHVSPRIIIHEITSSGQKMHLMRCLLRS